MRYQELISEFESKLGSLEFHTDDILYKAEQSIAKTETCIKQLRNEVIENGFDSKKEELSFFKHIKPQIFSSIDLGMTAVFEKRKLGAIIEEKYAYIQTADNYTLELMGLLESR